MPSYTEKQRRFMGAEYGRAKEGKKTRTGMEKEELREFARKPLRKQPRRSGGRGR